MTRQQAAGAVPTCAAGASPAALPVPFWPQSCRGASAAAGVAWRLLVSWPEPVRELLGAAAIRLDTRRPVAGVAFCAAPRCDISTSSAKPTGLVEVDAHGTARAALFAVLACALEQAVIARFCLSEAQAAHLCCLPGGILCVAGPPTLLACKGPCRACSCLRGHLRLLGCI